MNTKQRHVLLAILGLFLVVICFPPHKKSGMEDFRYRSTEFEASPLSISGSWVFRFLASPDREISENFVKNDEGGIIRIETRIYRFERMTTEWIVLMGFTLLLGLSVLILLK